MKKILWNIDNVKINVPDIYMEEYPEGGKTFKVGFDSKDIAENTGIVQFTFAVGYNGGVIMCNDYAVGSDGTISFDLPVGVHVEISGNEGTATKVSSGGGGSGEDDVLVINVTENNGTYSADKTYDEAYSALIDGKIVYLQVYEYGEKYLYICYDYYPDPVSLGYYPNLYFYSAMGGSYSNSDTKFYVSRYGYGKESGIFFDEYSVTVTPFAIPSAKYDGTKYTIQGRTAKELYEYIFDRGLGALVKYRNQQNQSTGECEYILSATKSGTNYTFKTLTKTFTASSDNEYPVQQI